MSASDTPTAAVSVVTTGLADTLSASVVLSDPLTSLVLSAVVGVRDAAGDGAVVLAEVGDDWRAGSIICSLLELTSIHSSALSCSPSQLTLTRDTRCPSPFISTVRTRHLRQR